jgi:Tol biopolymer transport system component
MRRFIALLGGSVAIATAMAVAASSSLSALPAKIVYQSRIAGENDEIVVASVNGKGLQRLAKSRALDVNPSWSAEGQRIAFESNRMLGNPNAYGDFDVFTMKANGKGLRQLTFSNAYDGDPAWGWLNRIAFESERTGNSDIWTIKSDGSGERQLTTSRALDRDPAWSPDGERIVFTSARDDGDYELYAMNADGSGQTRLTRSPGVDENASWSPDGKRIAFDSMRTGNLEIYSMKVDGTDVVRLTDHPALDALPSWSQDSRRIVFVSDRRGKERRRLFVMNADGTGVRMVTRGTYDMSPDWARG